MKTFYELRDAEGNRYIRMERQQTPATVTLIMGEGDKVLFRIQLSKEEFLELCDLRYRLVFEPEITAPILSLVRQDAA